MGQENQKNGAGEKESVADRLMKGKRHRGKGDDKHN